MECVINANILFSIANPNSVTRNIISNFAINLYSPKFALKEIKKYKQTIIKKAKLEDFDEYLQILEERINFIDIDKYKQEIKICKNLIEDEKDIEYLALAKRLNLPLWSNDKLLKNQNIVKVINTAEMVELI